MSFYGITGLFISSYLWCMVTWNLGSIYDRFDTKEYNFYSSRVNHKLILF